MTWKSRLLRSLPPPCPLLLQARRRVRQATQHLLSLELQVPRHELHLLCPLRSLRCLRPRLHDCLRLRSSHKKFHAVFRTLSARVSTWQHVLLAAVCRVGALGSSTAMLFCKVQLFGTSAGCRVTRRLQLRLLERHARNNCSHCCLTAFALA